MTQFYQNKKVLIGAAVVVAVGAIVAVRTIQSKKLPTTGAKAKVEKVLQVAHTQSYKPYDFVNDKGESDGFEVQVLKAVDEKLPDYKFNYNPTSDEDLLIGLESGKYDIGTKGAWKTPEREQKFIIPEEKIAASVIGLTALPAAQCERASKTRNPLRLHPTNSPCPRAPSRARRRQKTNWPRTSKPAKHPPAWPNCPRTLMS